MQEHLLLEVGDVIKIKKGACLSNLPENTLISVVNVYISPVDGERQYFLDWPGKTSTFTALMQCGADKYAMKLVRA